MIKYSKHTKHTISNGQTNHTLVWQPVYLSKWTVIFPNHVITQTQKILDDYYPRALQWCATGDLPEEIVSIDICKCYPSILLNNGCEIPVYSIHDVIEPYGCRSDLRLTGEFYIDETVLYNFGNPNKLEAGFYSNNLVSFLVEDLNMSEKQIKYKITTKKY